jgi:predicted HTH transcriptional regulator
MYLKQIISQPERRRLEFKETLPERSAIIAPVFKRMGIIDQWGNGLKLIADELKDYPNIELRWREVGLSFQVQFVKLDFVKEQELQQELQQELHAPTMYSEVLSKVKETPLSRKEISKSFGQRQISGQLNKVLSKLAEDKLIEDTIPENKNHPKQKFRITQRGVVLLNLLNRGQ